MRRTVEMIGGPKCGEKFVAEDTLLEYRVFVYRVREIDADTAFYGTAATEVPLLKDRYGVGVYRRYNGQHLFSFANPMTARYFGEYTTVDFYWQGEIDA